MYYRIGTKVRIEKGRRSSVWDGMTGTFAHISMPDRFGFWMYGIDLDEPDVNGKTKVIMVSTKPNEAHKRLTKLDTSELHPKFINYKKFKFK